MALIDKASLLMVPSTYEAGKLYNVLPSGNRAPDQTGENSGYDQTRADFDFDRGSNAAATRVNADGLIEKYRENLFTYSNDFSNSSWVKYQGGSVTSGQADKDGGTNAWKLNVVSSQSFSGLYKAISGSSVCTISVYAKAGTLDRLGIVNMSGVDFAVWFDLTNGTIGTQGGSNIDAKIEAVGTDGWYRVSFTQLLTSGDYFQLKPSDGETTPSGADGFIYIMNAQLETGIVATDYLESTSVTGKAGVLIDLPRIDYSSGAGALLLEPSRINAYLHSDYLYNFNGDETFNHATSPEGVSNATLLTKTSASDQFINMAWTGTTIAASSDYTMSIFVKHNGDDVNVRYEYNNSNDWGGVAWTALFEVRASGVTKSTAGNCTSDVEDYGNGWFRLKVFVTTGASITASSPANLFRVIGASGETLLVYGAQMEKGSYSTSLIPTYGTGVTRAADSCSVTGASDVIGQTEGTIYAEFDFHAYAGAVDRGLFSIGEAGQGYIDAIYVSSYNNDLYLAVYAGGSGQVNISKSNISIGKHKIAIAYKANDFAYYLDGVQIGTDSSGSLPTPLNFVGIGNINGGFLGDFDTTEFTLFNERLTNEELATLTTL